MTHTKESQVFSGRLTVLYGLLFSWGLLTTEFEPIHAIRPTRTW